MSIIKTYKIKVSDIQSLEKAKKRRAARISFKIPEELANILLPIVLNFKGTKSDLENIEFKITLKGIMGEKLKGKL